MKLDFAFICDYAELGAKVNALGIGFDVIHAKEVPCQHPSFFFVMQLRASVVEAGEKKVELRLIDEDGKDVVPPMRGRFVVPKPETGVESKGRIALALRNVTFPRYGPYSLHSLVDGHEMSAISLRISPPPAAK